MACVGCVPGLLPSDSHIPWGHRVPPTAELRGRNYRSMTFKGLPGLSETEVQAVKVFSSLLFFFLSSFGKEDSSLCKKFY